MVDSHMLRQMLWFPQRRSLISSTVLGLAVWAQDLPCGSLRYTRLCRPALGLLLGLGPGLLISMSCTGRSRAGSADLFGTGGGFALEHQGRGPPHDLRGRDAHPAGTGGFRGFRAKGLGSCEFGRLRRFVG